MPSGVWDSSEYEKLPDYDAPTSEQPPIVFGCHDVREGDVLCRGWWDCHSQNPQGHELLSIRLAAAFGRITELPPPSDVPCFESGQAACDHGLADVEEPSAEAEKRIEYLTNRHPDIISRSSAEADALPDASESGSQEHASEACAESLPDSSDP